ncbi:MAG: PAS domain S-box protein, partial [Alphaproteobacteria bacterium]
MKDIIGYDQDVFYADRAFGYSLMHPDDLDSYMKMLAKLKETGTAYETYRMRSASGGWLWFRDEVRLLPRDGNRPRECVGCMVEVTAEKETELALCRTQAFNHAIVEASQQGIVSVDVRGMIVGFNPSAEALFGHSLAAVLGKPVADLIIPEHLRGRHHDGFTRCVETGESKLIGQKVETEALHADGHLIPVELAFSRIEIDGDTQFVAEIRDISERVEADRRSQTAVQLLQDAVDSLPHGFSVLDKEGDYAVCNRAFAEIYGLKPEKLVGLNREDMIHLLADKVESVGGRVIENAEGLTQALTQTLGTPVEVKLKSGEWWQVTRQRTSDGGIAALRSDITSLKAAEEAASTSNAFILSLMNACPLPFGMTRLEDGFVIYESPASKHLFQRGLDGKAAYATSNFKSSRQREVYVEILKRDGFVDDFQIEAARADGTEFLGSLTARLVEFEGEEVIVFATDDLTRQHEIEAEMTRQQEALYQSEKLSALGELLAGIAHELNNPLSVLVGQALMLSERPVDAKTKERAEKIGSAADRCARIVKAFLAMARQQPTRSAETEINELVEGALEMTAYSLRSSDIAVQLQLSDDLPVIHGDPDQLRQVLINLLVNAQHALEEVGGERRLKVSTRYLKRSREVVLKVKDN